MTITAEFRSLLPTWALAVLLPIPMVTFWAEGSGRAFAYCYLFLGVAVVAAESFGRGAAGAWRAKFAALSLGAGGRSASCDLPPPEGVETGAVRGEECVAEGRGEPGHRNPPPSQRPSWDRHVG